MRLFIASGIFHPESGGPATYLKELLPELQKRGWNIQALTYGAGEVDSYPYPLTRIPRTKLRFPRYALAARPLLQWANLVYVHTLALPLIGGNAPRVLKIVGDQAWERAIRRGWIPPTTDIDHFQTARDNWKVLIQKSIRAAEPRRMDGIIVPSQYLKNMVMGWGVDAAKIQVIYNALPPDYAAAQMSQAEARLQLGLGSEPMLFTAARLNPWKGVDLLIAALARVPDVRLLVAGDGEMRVSLEQQAAKLGLSNRVTFLGNLPRTKVATYMKAADYFALYSGYEGLSHVLLESLRTGTPVIASDKGGNPEVVQHGVNGLLVTYVDVDALVAALTDAFRPGMRDSLAANSQHGMERFDFAYMVQQTHTALEGYL
jgi:glycosyltransferase involved in cell wall biosynthesis